MRAAKISEKMERKKKKSDKKSKAAAGAKKAPAKEETKKVALPKSITTRADGKVQILVEAKPGSKKDEVLEVCDEFVGISVQAEPRAGEANANIIEFVADVLGVKKTSVAIDKGSKSKSKVVEVAGITAAEVYEKLKASCDSR